MLFLSSYEVAEWCTESRLASYRYILHLNLIC